MRILGLDVGTKTIGIAVSDELLYSAQPLEVLRRTSPEKDIVSVADIANSFQCSRIVVGMPRNMNGTYGPSADAAKEFMKALSGVTDIPVDSWDERMTTVVANKALIEANLRREKRRAVIDKVAAAVILQGYLDAHSSRSPTILK